MQVRSSCRRLGRRAAAAAPAAYPGCASRIAASWSDGRHQPALVDTMSWSAWALVAARVLAVVAVRSIVACVGVTPVARQRTIRPARCTWAAVLYRQPPQERTLSLCRSTRDTDSAQSISWQARSQERLLRCCLERRSECQGHVWSALRRIRPRAGAESVSRPCFKLSRRIDV